MSKAIEVALTVAFGYMGRAIGGYMFPEYSFTLGILGMIFGSLLCYSAGPTISSVLENYKFDNVKLVSVIFSLVFSANLLFSNIEDGSTLFDENYFWSIFFFFGSSITTGLLWALCVENKLLLIITILIYGGSTYFFITPLGGNATPIEALIVTHSIIGIPFGLYSAVSGRIKNRNKRQ